MILLLFNDLSIFIINLVSLFQDDTINLLCSKLRRDRVFPQLR